MEKVSVIIPIYNAEDTLTSCVNGILEQTYGNLELILINDGSVDGSGALCDACIAKDPRVVVRHQENQGVSAARNWGMLNCTGDYITFVDADDVVPPDYLEILVDTCRDADIAVCDVVCIKDGCEISRFTHPEGVLSQSEALDLLLERRRINSGPCAKLFRQKVLEGLAFPPLKIYEDILFVRDAFANAGRIAVTDRTAYHYIQNPAGAMSHFSKKPGMDIIRATENLMHFIAKREDLSSEAFYITASHLMQYVIPVVAAPESCDFVRSAQRLYKSFWKQIVACPAFPWKEKVVFLLFICGWLYAEGRLVRTM